MSTILQYKCPCCGGSIEFNAKAQKLKCPYCDTEFDEEVLKSYDTELLQDKDDEISWDEDTENKWEEKDKNGLFSFVCNSCGGEIIGDSTLGATKCPFCDSPVVLKRSFDGDFKPDYIIPFKLDKKEAKVRLKNHLTGKKLLPRIFKDENHIEEIKGMYVPFWLFDADVDAHLRFRGLKIRTWSDKNYNYTETRHYSIVRSGSISFDNVPVDGSSKMDDELMESIEPFDFNDAVRFEPSYLAGYMADRYDVTADETRQNAKRRIRRTTEELFRNTISGYTSVTTEGGNVNMKDGKAKYVLYPVWILNTVWKGERYVFAMNGQTGKFVGNLPVDNAAYYKWFGIYAAAGFAVSMIAALLFHMFF